MKKIVVLIVIAIVVTIYYCCNNNIEASAKGRLQYLHENPDDPAWHEFHINPSTKDILKDIKLGFIDQNICTLNYNVTVFTPEGKTITIPCEYLYTEMYPNHKVFDQHTDDKLMISECITTLIPEDKIRMDEEMIQYESILKKKGISMRYLMTHSVKDVAKTYRKQIMAYGHIRANDPNLEHCLLYHAAILKVKFHGRMIRYTQHNANISTRIKNMLGEYL